MNFVKNQSRLLVVILLLILATVTGDLAPTFGICCAYGANWARESQQCSAFPTPINELPTEHQSICVTAAGICCLRYFRNEQCQKGSQAAQLGHDCLPSSSQGGEYFKDCCQACKLGIFSGGMGMGCGTRFKFGFPWDNAYHDCCNQATSSNLSPNLPGNQVIDNENLYPGVPSSPSGIPDPENLCEQLSGKLCSDFCVPTPGSYRCMCRPGFTLSRDGKTCIQDAVNNRCEENNPCDHICMDTGVSIVCSCNPGFILEADQKSCEDINECSSGVHGCVAVEQVCYNLVGSYVCINADGSFSAPGPTPIQPASPSGLPADSRITAFDKNEVVQGRNPLIRGGHGTLGVQGFPGASPEPGLSGFSQSHGRCPPGYSFNLDSQACDDVDECQVTSGLCVRGTICQNTIGSYTCTHMPVVDCPSGFAFDLNLQSCLDVDECEDGSHNCNWTTHLCVNNQGGYMCQEKSGSSECVAGYKFSTQQQKCIDIDECTENSDSCDRETQTCINSQGSFRCIDRKPICDFGYRYNEELQSCVDIDECTEDTHDCSSVETCVNHLGHYTCQHRSVDGDSLNSTAYNKENNEDVSDYEVVLAKRPGDGGNKRSRCSAGYRYNRRRRTCVDIDECATNPCKAFEVCENSQGSYQCQCLAGYSREEPDGDCEDMNECQLDLHTCTSTQRCDNTVGSYACIRIAGCGTGYTLNHNTGECDDNDECKLNTHNCYQLGPKYQCVNIRGSFRCKHKTCSPFHILNDEGNCVVRSCDVGYRPGEFNCVDIDECIEDNPCRQNERCTNTLGSYKCQPRLNCYAGFEMNEAGTQCVDIDECAKGTHQCVGNQLCSNRQGSYICYCPQGFRRNTQQQCEDINECESYRGRVCANNADCENTEGSFICKCKAGFKQAANGLSCIDVDECEETPEICQHNCINVWGTYYCTCNAGHILNSDNRTCSDVDECENARNRGHLCIGLCVNVPGSFKCTCPDGYTLAADGRTCKDINECETSNVCRGIGEQCVNTQGGYKCNTITCPDNYVRDSRHKNRCERLASHCQLGDDACRLKPLSYSYNYLPLVSNLTLPSVGEVNIFTMRGPLWSTTTVQFELELEYVETSPEVQPVTRDYFRLKRTAYNQAVISLVKSIIGPQEIQLSLNMKLYQQGRYSGSAVAKLLLYVSEYTF